MLYYYGMCKGDMAKVVDCMIYGSAEDVMRWRRNIVDPAVRCGEVDDYVGKKSCNEHPSKTRRTILEEESSSDEEIAKATNSFKSKSQRAKNKAKNDSFLIDTDEEEDDAPQRNPCPSASSSMSKKDRMDYRVAKKRKAKAGKEMEMADIIQSKNWDVISAMNQSQPRKDKNMGGISDVVLSKIEKKYGNNTKRKKWR